MLFKRGLIDSTSQWVKADVMANLDKVRELKLAMTDREHSLLAVIVTELQAARHDPFGEHYIVQVASRLDFKCL